MATPSNDHHSLSRDLSENAILYVRKYNFMQEGFLRINLLQHIVIYIDIAIPATTVHITCTFLEL